MDFFIKETNVRGGNRGGKNLFNWEDVRLLSSKERQSYLGSTQALGLMDRGGKWCKRDWWTHYNSKVNIYGHKDRLNNRSALLEEQKEIRKKEREKLNEFIYGKKKKNNLMINDAESIKEQINKIENNNNMNNSEKSEFNEMSRPGLGMKSPISIKNSEINLKKEKTDLKNENSLYGNKSEKSEKNFGKKDNDHKDKQKHSHHRHHHHHHSHHRSKDKSKISSKNRSISRKRSRSRSRSRSKNESAYKKNIGKHEKY